MIDIDSLYKKTPYLNSELPYLILILNAKSFYYYSIDELGCGYHTIIWWKNKKGICYFFEDYTSDNKLKKYPSRVIHYRKIESDKFDRFMANLVNAGIIDLKIEENNHKLSNRHGYHYIFLENSDLNGFQTGMGFEHPPALGEIGDIVINMESESIRKGRKIKKRYGEDFYEK